MNKFQIQVILLFFLISLFSIGILGAYLINTDSGSISVRYVAIPHYNGIIVLVLQVD